MAKNTKPTAEDLAAQVSIQKLIVGHCIEAVPENMNKKVIYSWQGNGIWEIRKLKLGTFITHTKKFNTPGLESTLTEGWTLNVPKMPASLLDMALSFFRKIYAEHSSEVFLQIFYDTEKKEYLMHCPRQSVGGASVSYIRDASLETPEKILVFEVHSHGSMPAFFSGTDDNDEKDDRFFGVIGKVKQFYPEMKLRLSMGGHRSEIEIEDIFDLDETNFHEEFFPQEWVKNIKKEKAKPVAVSRYGPTQSGRRYKGPGSRYTGRVYYPQNEDDYLYPGDSRFDAQAQGALFNFDEMAAAYAAAEMDELDKAWDDSRWAELNKKYSQERGASVVGAEENVTYQQIGSKYYRVVKDRNRTYYEELEELEGHDLKEEEQHDIQRDCDTKKEHEDIIKDWRGIKW